MEKLLKRVSHRFLMVLLDLCAILSIMVQCIDLSFFPLFLGRILVGMIIGLNSGIIPRYIFGVTPK
jgi:predicted MFS family arabinose efflux permease